jgi:ParB family transcriptional regulator, chromosome partitioning protein
LLLTRGFIEDINISKIRRGKNIRSSVEADNLDELMLSMQQIGLLQPILVRAVDGYFEIVAGNRRFQASKNLGWKKITCHIIELDEKQAFEISLMENVQRKTLSPLEEAAAFKTYISDYGWGGTSELASKIGKSISYVVKRIKLLELPDDVLHTITSHKLNTSLAEELFTIKDMDKQSMLADLIADRRLSLRKARDLLKGIKQGNIDLESFCDNGYGEHIKLAEKSFDKTITALRIAMNSLSDIINSIEGDWILYETLMQHKNMLHQQIDVLIKEKKKFER